MELSILRQAKEHFRTADPLLSDLADRYTDYRPQIASGPAFAVLCESIVSQQLSVKAADVIYGRVQDLLGEVMPERVLAADDEALRACGLSRPKVRYVRHLAEAIVTGLVVPADFPNLTDAAIIEQLLRVKGIGLWTAQMYLIFGLGRPDVLPVADLGLRRAVMLRYGLEAMPEADTLHRIGAPWAPYRSAATLFLWRSLAD